MKEAGEGDMGEEEEESITYGTKLGEFTGI